MLDCGGLWPVPDGIYLPLVHLHTLFSDDIPKEMDGVAVELQLEIKVVFFSASGGPASCVGNVRPGSRSR